MKYGPLYFLAWVLMTLLVAFWAGSGDDAPRGAGLLTFLAINAIAWAIWSVSRWIVRGARRGPPED